MSAIDDNHVDDHVDEEIRSYIRLDQPQSFILYAGAGSGKTRSLVDAIRHATATLGNKLHLRRQSIAVITYTNAACDEIKQRLSFDPLVDVRTIHSFSWSLIEGRTEDIRRWLAHNLLLEIEDLKAQQARGRASKASEARARSIISKQARHDRLNEIRRFIYSPSGDNRTRDSLNHAEVIAMTAEFLTKKIGLQQLLISRSPFLLIDESQDTNKRLMEAFLHVQNRHAQKFCLGLFGDMMQRIYADGLAGLDSAIPDTWMRPEKVMNHRCPARIVTLINRIRAEGDGHKQQPRSNKRDGHVNLFILREDTEDKQGAEISVQERMAAITGDAAWTDSNAVKTLTLEHHMAARRLGFEQLFESLYQVERIRTSLLDGTLPGLTFFTRQILPLAKALGESDPFAVASVVKQYSPLLDKKRLSEAGVQQVDLIRASREAVKALKNLIDKPEDSDLRSVLHLVYETRLFSIPESLLPFVQVDEVAPQDVSEEDNQERDASEAAAWESALNVPLSQVIAYDYYIRGVSRFDTHQGVKGLEFPRVMVVISDEEARGFMFSYDKLFGAKAKTKSDTDNESQGNETSIDRTRRLFYVICSRAEESLAIVCYSSDPERVKQAVVSRDWFTEAEVAMM